MSWMQPNASVMHTFCEATIYGTIWGPFPVLESFGVQSGDHFAGLLFLIRVT